MHFIKAVALGLSTISGLVTAQSTTLAFTETPASVKAGTPVTIKYASPDNSLPATIILRQGSPDDLNTISVLTSSATNGTYTWIPADSLADASDYALEITQGDSINYSGEFSLSGANPAAVSSAEAATASESAYEASITSSLYASSAIASIESVISSYNASLTNLTATTSSRSTVLPATATLGTGIPMSRNTTMSGASLTSSKSSGSGSGSGSGTGTSTTTATITQGSSSATTTGSGAASQGGSTGTSASASATKTGAGAVSGSSPLALIFCAFAAVAFLK